MAERCLDYSIHLIITIYIEIAFMMEEYVPSLAKMDLFELDLHNQIQCNVVVKG